MKPEKTIEQLAASASDQSPKKVRLKWPLIGVVVAVVIIIIVSLTAFALWMNSPQKALMDAANHALENPARYTLKSKGVTASLDVGGKAYHASAVIDGLNTEAIISGSTLYLRSDNPKALLARMTGEQPGLLGVLRPILSQLKNQWISLSLERPVIKSTDISGLNCLVTARDSLAHNGEAQRELLSTYAGQQFIGISSVKSAGSDMSYVLSLDGAKLQSFKTAFTKTNLFASLVSCMGFINQPLDTSQLSGAKATVVLSPDHHLKMISLSGVFDDSLQVTADYDAHPTIKIPRDVKTTDQIVIDLFRGFIPD